MKAEFAARAHVYSEDLRDLHLKLDRLAQMTTDETILRRLTFAISSVDIAQKELSVVAHRSAQIVLGEERQKTSLIEQLEASLARVACSEVGSAQ